MNKARYPIFPEDISLGAKGGPSFRTDIFYRLNGAEKRVAIFSHPRIKFQLNFNLQTTEQIDRIIAFFRFCRGREGKFLFKDWADYKLNDYFTTNNNGHINLHKIYNFCDNEYITKRPIKYINYSSLRVENENNTISYTDQASFNNGLLAIDGNIMNQKVHIVCEFYILARFDIDELNIIIESSQSFATEEIKIIEIDE